jgi:hypothetical protein
MIRRLLVFNECTVRLYFRDEAHLDDWQEDNRHLLHYLAPMEGEGDY